MRVPIILPELLLNSGEPDDPPSVTPCPFELADQVTLQCVFETEPQVVETVVPLKVDIFLMSPAGW